MRILFVITGLGLGGAEKVVITLADALYQQGHDVKIAYLKAPVVVKPRSEIELIDLGFKHLFSIFGSAQKLKQYVQHFKPDVVHAHLFHACIFMRIFRLYCDFPYLICTAHSKKVGHGLRKILYALTNRWSDLNTNVSFEATSHFIKAGAFKTQNSQAVSNGIDTDLFQFNQETRLLLRKKFNIAPEVQVLIAVGRLNEAKDYQNLIHSFVKLKQHNHALLLYIIGDGELRLEIENLIQGFDLQQHIILLGARLDISDLLCMADIFVLSSAWEGFGLVVAEAMSCERVVVATNCGGVEEVLNDSQWLVQPKNTPQLIKRLQKALDIDDIQKQNIGEKNRKRIVQHYSVDCMVRRWLKIYEKK